MDKPTDQSRMDKIVSLAKRRGFIFQSSEIYGGLNGFWDYGPLGVALKRNLKDAWWHDMVAGHDELATPAGAPQPYEMAGLDCTIIMHPQVWKCSGHFDLFHDWMIDCRESKKRYRFDHLQPSSPQAGDAATGHPRVGVDHGHHHLGDAGLDQRLGAGRCAAVVAAGLQGHDQGAAAGSCPGLGQGSHFGMGIAGAGMEALSHQLACGIEHHGPHQGVGAGATLPQGGQAQGPPHPGEPRAWACGAGNAHPLPSAPSQSGRLRHSFTT